MKKTIFLILLFCIILFKSSFAQTFADKKYYLIDSLDLTKLTPNDKYLLDSCLEVFHSAKHDTDKVNALSSICENMLHEDWSKYQFYQHDFIEKILSGNYPNKIKNNLLHSNAAALNNIGFFYKNHGENLKALKYYYESLKIHNQINKKNGIADNLINIAQIYYEQGDIPKSLEAYNKSAKILKNIGDKKGLSIILNSIALIYRNQNDIDKSLELLEESMKITKELGDKELIAQSYNNIGVIYKQQGKFKEAFEFYNNSLKIREELGLKREIAVSLNNIGTLYISQGDWENAIEFFNKSLSIHKSIKNKKGISESLYNIGNSIYHKQDKAFKAIPYLQNSLKISKELGSPIYISLSAELLSKIYEKQGKGMEALEMHKLYVSMHDSINNEATQKATAQQQAKYEYEKQKALDDAEHEKLIAIEQEEKQKQKIITYATGGGLALVVLFLAFVFNRLQVTRKQKNIIEEKEKETHAQKKIIEEKHKEITDSINYAERIQRSFLATREMLDENLRDYFVFFKPKDVVSGDFYWAAQLQNNSFAFTVADSTGHGVPGAIMSILNISSLEKSIETQTEPHNILFETRKIIINRLKKDGSPEGGKDGMDCSLLVLNQDKTQLSFASAHNPVIIIRNQELLEFRGDKMPVGKHDRENDPFTLHTITLQKGDVIYALTDGFPDQFGGDKGKKFMIKNLKELLLQIAHLPMPQQEQKLADEFDKWKGANEQVDDVCIIGVRV